MAYKDKATITTCHGTPASGEPTDDDLMQRVRAGDEHAFAILFARYHREVRAFIAARLHGDLVTADDVTSDVFAKVFRSRDRFHGGSFRGWLYQIARNTLVDHHRAQKPVTSIEGELDLVSTTPEPDAVAMASEARDHLLAALSTLSPVPHRIVEMRLKGYPLDAICADLDMELSAVKSAQHRAFRKLRNLLHEPLADHLPDRSPRP